MAMATALQAAFREPAFHIEKEDLRLQPELLKELFRLWLPMFFNSLIISFGGLFVEKHTNQIGSAFTAGISACMKLFSLLEAIIMAIQTGVSVYVGQNLGARRYRRIKTGLVEIVKLGFGLITAMILLVFATQQWILPLFLSAENPEAYQRAYEAASVNTHIILLSMLIMTPMYLHRVTIQTLGFPGYAAAAGVMQLIMRVATVLIGPSVIGEYAYFIQDGMAWLVSLPIVAIPCYRFLGEKIRES
jgi:Na+-driven multidrug efflux pump